MHQFLDARNTDQTELFLQRPEIIYGFAFHPNFTENRLVYVGCNGRSEALQDVATRVLQFRVEGDGPYRCDPLSEKLIIEWPSNGHNGGDLEFGEHGFLFVSTGDGTSDSDVARNGQNLSTLNGSMLRIDVGPFQDASDGRPSLDNHVSADLPYRIPLDNPFLKVAGARGEIWAYGLRNPWRFAFDSATGDLWIADVGQGSREEINLEPAGSGGGRNYGWKAWEGDVRFSDVGGADRLGYAVTVDVQRDPSVMSPIVVRAAISTPGRAEVPCRPAEVVLESGDSIAEFSFELDEDQRPNTHSVKVLAATDREIAFAARKVSTSGHVVAPPSPRPSTR